MTIKKKNKVMKANEIMISDYLSYKGQIIKVASITKKKVGYHIKDNEHRMHYARLCECKPIFITPEILEKNGFVNVENTQTSTIIYYFSDSLLRIEVYDFNHITIKSYYTDSFCDRFISAIHELQQAMRLLGIEKEIIL